MVWDLRSLCDKADYAIIRYAINRIRLYNFVGRPHYDGCKCRKQKILEWFNGKYQTAQSEKHCRLYILYRYMCVYIEIEKISVFRKVLSKQFIDKHRAMFIINQTQLHKIVLMFYCVGLGPPDDHSKG